MVEKMNVLDYLIIEGIDWSKSRRWLQFYQILNWFLRDLMWNFKRGKMTCWGSQIHEYILQIMSQLLVFKFKLFFKAYFQKASIFIIEQ